MLKVSVFFNAHGVKETKNLLLPNFNGHADDVKAVRQAAMKEAREKGWPVNHIQGVTRRPNIKHEVKAK